VFIEGDNLDALKLLRESLLDSVKLIYIDPPYNTGRDFIYNDAFAAENDEYLIASNQETGSGDRSCRHGLVLASVVSPATARPGRNGRSGAPDQPGLHQVSGHGQGLRQEIGLIQQPSAAQLGLQ
jgi:hypothetical protein